MAGVLNDLGQTILPSVFSSLNAAGLVDLMTIQTEGNATTGTGGGRIKGTPTSAYTAVPVSYEPTVSGKRIFVAERNISVQQYTLTFPTHQSGVRLNIDPKLHRLIVTARGNEPAKTFRILSIMDVSGVVFEAICEREN
jgi:hypothetical protein